MQNKRYTVQFFHRSMTDCAASPQAAIIFLDFLELTDFVNLAELTNFENLLNSQRLNSQRSLNSQKREFLPPGQPPFIN